VNGVVVGTTLTPLYPPFSILGCGYPGGDGQTTDCRRISVVLSYQLGDVMLDCSGEPASVKPTRLAFEAQDDMCRSWMA
jgi:hypothetical protein